MRKPVYTLLICVVASIGICQDRLDYALDFPRELKQRWVAVAPNDTVYVLDDVDGSVLMVQPNKGRIKSIGQRGEGPGDLLDPWSICFHDGMLVVVDDHHVNLFGPDGNFLEKILVERMKDPKPVKGGWILTEFAMAFDPSVDAKVAFYSPSMTKVADLFQWKRDPVAAKFPKTVVDGERTHFYNPSRPETLTAVDDRGDTYFLLPGNSNTVYVVDTATKTVRPFTIKQRRAGFNTFWGEARFEEEKERSNRDIKVVPDFPEYFPLAKGMVYDPSVGLTLSLWMPNPHDGKVVAYDRQGNEVASPLHPSVVENAVVVRKDAVFVLTWNSDDESASLVKTSYATADRVVTSQ